LRKKSPNSFSSGQKKKILLAQALVHNPDIIIMDEPVANLDPKARADFFSVLNDLKKQGKAIFISSHVLPELDAYFDSATILDGGKIVFSGSKAELEKKFNRPNYTIISDHDQKIIKYFTQNKLKYIVEPILKQIIFYPKDKNEIKQLQIFALKNNIFFDNFVKNAPTLDDVYRKLVIKGSVDTGKT
jgi:ABC-2 type transport system ATP-binding protein